MRLDFKEEQMLRMECIDKKFFAVAVLGFSLQFLSPLGSVIPIAMASEQNGSYNASYDVSLAGLGMARIDVSVTIDNNNYTVAGVGKPAYLGTLFMDGKVSVSSSGKLKNTKIDPDQYNLSFSSEDENAVVDMKIGNSNIVELTAEPELDEHSDRVPVSKDHHVGIIDPVSAIMVPMVRNGNGLDPKTCDRSAPVHDGWYRYNIQLSYKGIEQVKSNNYKSEAIVCNVRWVPIAGHRSEKDNTKYMMENRDIEIWLVPLNGTEMLVPYLISIRTKAGTLRFKVDEINMS